ncbi:hypothetical protein MtrunA17_Chr1g0191431 [Medicago truncatula]|uniref:Uncharacterized protein n=1 Tax=Medicago truncatula TaxID=3880 RepID=G7I7H2_MEDTR|nr:hypothetical protein MTR_1g082370 [Medicago truncatula]RHN80731.1 hypothetical protein MtrunA17_Chr1g0191431 [Medicago truncatula]
MDQRELHLQHLGICYKLYYFITKTLASQALKTVTLGCSARYSSTSTAPRGSDCEADKVLRLGIPCNKDSPCTKVDEMVKEGTTRLPKRISLKKSVSICDNVEQILPNKKIKKRSKSFQKSSSLDQEEEEEPKPLRSILKVGSDLNDQSNSIC